ncbi:MAG: GGDEF domain-containing protein [Gammaproteobacteria bacterium]|nr:GGDEF domain-containing protein [Gammaproteobacteria bacterium]
MKKFSFSVSILCLVALASLSAKADPRELPAWYPETASQLIEELGDDKERLLQESNLYPVDIQTFVANYVAENYSLEGRFAEASAVLNSLADQKDSMGNTAQVDWLLNIGSVLGILNPESVAGCKSLDEAMSKVDAESTPRLYITAVSTFVPCIASDYSRRAELFSLLGDAIRVADQVDVDATTNILLLGALADAYIASDRMEPAMRSIDQAYSLARELNIPVEMFNIQFNKALAGFFARDSSVMKLAISELESIMSAGSSVGDGDFFISYLRGLMYSPLLLNDVQQSVENLERAVALADTTEETFFATDASVTLLIVYLYQGEFDLADALEAQIVDEWGDASLSYDPYVQIAMASRNGDPRHAINYATALDNYYINRSVELARFAQIDREAGEQSWVGEAYQAEIARQQLEIERLNAQRVQTENEIMHTRQRVGYVVTVVLVLLVLYLLFSRNQFRRLSLTDTLTGLANRRKAYFKLEEAIAASQEGRINSAEHEGVGVILLDVDYFKTINDCFGHDYGDRVLREVAKLISRAVHGSETAARFGGEEFIVVLPQTTLSKTRETAERIRMCVENHVFDLPERTFITISAGVHVETPIEVKTTSDEITKAADMALYMAKSSGRNCVVSSERLDEEMLQTELELQGTKKERAHRERARVQSF